MDLEKIKTLLDFVGQSRVSQLTVSEAGTTVVIRNNSRMADGGPSPGAIELRALPVSATGAPATRDDETDGGFVRSVVAGVVHQAASPGAVPLIAVGDTVEASQALCIVEAMKVFTTVSAPFGGTITRIFFEDGQDIGFGDLLVEIVR